MSDFTWIRLILVRDASNQYSYSRDNLEKKPLCRHILKYIFCNICYWANDFEEKNCFERKNLSSYFKEKEKWLKVNYSEKSQLICFY